MKEIVYHGTNSVFDHFDLDYCGTINENAANSKLGFFFGSSLVKKNNDCPEFLHHFGGYIIKAELDISDLYVMPIEEFSDIHHKGFDDDDNRNVPFWLKKRKEFLDKGFKVIAIKEFNKVDGRDDNISIYIVLDTDVILKHEYVQSPGLKFWLIF